MKQADEAERLERRAYSLMFGDYFSTPTPIESGVINDRAIHKPTPFYPEEAKQMRQTGTVTVRIVVNERGIVVWACAISGPAVFWRATEQAAYRALFSPTEINGQPVKVTGLITYNFILR